MGRTSKVLVIQTAFLGDVVLATALIETLHKQDPRIEIHFLLRKGNESLLKGHPFLKQVWVYDKANKFSSIWHLVSAFRKEKFDAVFNLHRFLSSGLMAIASGSNFVAGFDKNPLSFLYTKQVEHVIPFPFLKDGPYLHETERNQMVLSSWISASLCKPKLYPGPEDFEKVKGMAQQAFVTMAPGSVWPTKRLPESKWVELVNTVPETYSIYFIGAPSEIELIDTLINKVRNRKGVSNWAGKLSLLQSAALMSLAERNFVNDSGPLHLASAMDAPVTAYFLSTIPEFGFGPLSTDSIVVEIEEKLSCRPCGIHGFKECPQQHFRCGLNVRIDSKLPKK
jgi:ADP-heptose:LPS heptosyltransferase